MCQNKRLLVAAHTHVGVQQVLVMGADMQDAADLAWWQQVPPNSPKGSPQGTGEASSKGAQAASKAKLHDMCSNERMLVATNTDVGV